MSFSRFGGSKEERMKRPGQNNGRGEVQMQVQVLSDSLGKADGLVVVASSYKGPETYSM
jgi:hypothetical protein